MSPSRIDPGPLFSIMCACFASKEDTHGHHHSAPVNSLFKRHDLASQRPEAIYKRNGFFTKMVETTGNIRVPT